MKEAGEVCGGRGGYGESMGMRVDVVTGRDSSVVEHRRRRAICDGSGVLLFEIEARIETDVSDRDTRQRRRAVARLLMKNVTVALRGI